MFLKGYAKCKVNGYIKVTFTVAAERVQQEDIVVHVEVENKCTHEFSSEDKTDSHGHSESFAMNLLLGGHHLMQEKTAKRMRKS